MHRNAAVFSVVCLALMSACVAVVPYDPDQDLVAELGRQSAEDRLNEVMIRAVEPRISSAEVQGNVLRYEVNSVVVGAWYTTTEVTSTRNISLPALTKVEIYENNKIYVYEGNRVTHQILFPTLEDAKTAADLLMSFRDAAASNGGGGGAR